VTGPRRRRSARRPPARGDYVRVNRATWDRIAREYESRHIATLRREDARAWGTFRVPERALRLLENVRGKDVLELGCGAAWWSIALAQDGARVVGLDFSPIRLAQARDRMRAARVEFPLVEARAEAIPFPRHRFDVVLSDYGATTFTDPYRTIPEAARVLRPGGLLVFAHASPFRSMTEDARNDHQTRRLHRDYFGLHELRFEDSIEFQLPYGEWIRLFRGCGLSVEALVEPVAPSSWRSTYMASRDQAWARHWPYDVIWKLRKERSPTARTPRAGPGGSTVPRRPSPRR
jgi:ubiquinone/menaquinone biosynthesis C-methylase UbiE